MKAIWYDQPGPAQEVLQYGETATPSPGPGEVRVKIHASGINPSDTKFRSGWMGLKQPYDRTIPHNDGAGVIDELGEGVDRDRRHQRVWIYEAQRGSAFGTAAEYVVVPAEKALPLPDGFSFAAGASLGVPAMTAHHCLFSHGSVAGKTVLVHGGAGAVGSFAIQLARWGGAEQIMATVSSAAKAKVAEAMGADCVINYRDQDVVAGVKESLGRRGCDRIIDVALATNMAINAKLVARNGCIATYESGNAATVEIPFYDLLYKNATLRTVLVYAMSDEAHGEAARDVSRAIAEGAIQPLATTSYPLSETAAAHDALDSGQVIGKVIVEPD